MNEHGENETGKPLPPLPGDLPDEQRLARMIRVDHAGEHGAVRIYEGQLSVLGDSPAAAPIRRMAMQEQRHLETFDELIATRRVRPTALSPLWHVAGYALGGMTALMGPRAAMACTVAVEEVIDEHYARQSAALARMEGADEAALRETIEEFRQDEIDHRDEALAQGAREAAAYRPLTETIKAASRLAIWLSERF
ncbi:MAG: demethoxyubiquinone hydroxylase family protein [Alphaproteobacteria bacterium]